MRRSGAGPWPALAWSIAGALGLAVLSAIVYWPGLRSFPEGDDFVLLAYARILRNPLALFVHEHFPLGPYFRPLTLGLWWLSARAFGNAVAPQYALNLGLHIACSLALWRLLNACAPRSRMHGPIALLFALHPLTIGTSLWLADRFDLLATLFGLLALSAAAKARRAWSAAHVAAACAFAVAAVLAKETGLVAAALAGGLWALPVRAHPERDPARLRVGSGLLLLVLCLCWFVWRLRLLHAGAGGFGLGDTPALTLFARGGLAWVEDFAAYLCAWGRMPAPMRALLLCGAGALAAAAALAVRRRGARAEPAPWLALACAAVIIVGSALLEAPYAYIWSVPFARSSVPAALAGYARLYYFPLCGIALAAAALAGMLAPRGAPGWRGGTALAGLGAAMLGLAWAATAHDLANAYRRQSNEKRGLVAAAVAAVEAAPLPAQHCRVFLLGVDAGEPGYVLKTSTDAVIKALAADERRVERCLFQSEQASWIDVVPAGELTAASAAPLRPMRGPDGPAPWLQVGGLQIAYLNLDQDIDARALDDAIFLRWDAGRFADVSAAVRAGAVAVRFHCARRRGQCSP